MQVTGIVKQIGETASFGLKDFLKREFVVTTVEQYPQHILIELHGHRVDLIDPYKIGDNVVVTFNLNGREWDNGKGEIRYFNSLVAWKIQYFKS